MCVKILQGWYFFNNNLYYTYQNFQHVKEYVKQDM